MISLARAEAIAETAVKQLADWCERIEVAGSVRRKRAMVGDVDVVVLPRSREAEIELRARCRMRAEVVRDGKSVLAVRLTNGVQVELWFATRDRNELFESVPSNWGSVLLCRTGSKEFNVGLCRRAIEMGMKWEHGRGLVRKAESGEVIVASRTETHIFLALGMEFVEPERREAGYFKSQISDLRGEERLLTPALSSTEEERENGARSGKT